MRSFHRAFFVAAMCLSAFALASPAASDGDAELTALLETAQAAYDDGMATAANGAARRAEFARAAGAFAALRAQGVSSAALEYNLANAYFRSGDQGRAVAHYLLALELDPRNARARANLEYVRRQVTPAIRPARPNAFLRSALFLHTELSAAARVAVIAIAGVVGWALLALRLRRPRPYLTVLGGLGVVVSISLGVALLWQLHEDEIHPPAVVVQEHPLLLGRGEGYERVLADPLGPGVEVRVRSTRGGWAEIELADGRTGWLPDAGVLRLRDA